MQRSNPKCPQYFSVIGMSCKDATMVANEYTKKYEVYFTAVRNPTPHIKEYPTWIISNCYHPWQEFKDSWKLGNYIPTTR